MYTGHMDIGSFLLYIVLGLFSAYMIRKMIKIQSKYGLLSKKNKYMFFMGCFIIVLLFFASFRKVGYLIGGMDMYGYINDFQNISNIKPNKGVFAEHLFYYYTVVIAFFTDNYRIYMAISYFIILLGYVMFIRTYTPNRVSSIPFVMIIFPFLKSFNTLTTGIAVSIFLIGLSIGKTNKKLGNFIIISTFFIHRMSILFICYIVFDYIYDKVIKLEVKQKKKIFMLTILGIILAYFLARYAQKKILSLGILDITDSWYMSQSFNSNIISRWPMFFPQALLLLSMMLWNKDIHENGKVNEVKKLCVFDFIVVPVALVLGVWRANEYLYLARLMMWGEIIEVSGKRFGINSRLLYKLFCLCGVVVWLSYRIYSEWDDMKIMPYIFEFI